MRSFSLATLSTVSLSLLAPSSIATAQCAAGHFLGKTVYRTTTLTPTACGAWVATALSSPVTILDCDRVGVWQRACTYTQTVSDKTVSQCYRSRWDRFWAWGGYKKVITTAAGPGHNAVVNHTQTVVCFSSTPPGAALPAVSSSLTVHDPPIPGASVLIKFSEMGAAISMPMMPTLPGNGLGQASLMLAGLYNNARIAMADLATEAATLDDPEVLLSVFATDFAQLQFQIQAVSAELATGVPSDPAPYFNLAQGLNLFASHLGLLAAAPSYSRGVADLNRAASFLAAAGNNLAQGLYGHDPLACDRRGQFVQNLLAVGTSCRDFASSVEELGCDGQSYGNLAAGGGDIDWWALDLELATDLDIYTTSRGTVDADAGGTSADDTVIRLYAPDGVTQIAFNDDYLGRPIGQRGFLSRIRVLGLVPGRYYIEVRGFSPIDAGNYALDIYCGAPGAGLANFATDGVGCFGSNGIRLRVVPRRNEWPRIGSTFTLDTDGGVSPPVVLIGIGPFGPIIDLGIIGAPGCGLGLSPLTGPLPTSLTVADESEFSLVLIDDPGMVGFVVHVQAATLDPPANALGIVLSNRLTLTIGADA